MATKRYTATGFAILDYNNKSVNDHTSQRTTTDAQDLALKFPELDISGTESVTSAKLYFYVGEQIVSFASTASYSAYALNNTFDPSTATYSNLASFDDTYYQYVVASSSGWYSIDIRLNYSLTNLKKVVNNGVRLSASHRAIYTSASSYKPYIEITTGGYPEPIPTVPEFKGLSTQYISARTSYAVYAFATQSAYTINPVDFDCALEWKGSDGVTREIAVPSGALSVNTPIVTIPEGDVSFRTVAYNSSGAKIYSDWLEMYCLGLSTSFTELNSNKLNSVLTAGNSMIKWTPTAEDQLISANFEWRETGSSQGGYIYSVGNIFSIPAGTFDASKTYEVYFHVTYDTGTSYAATTSTVKVLAPVLSNFSPKNGFVNELDPTIFTWGLTYAEQKSASFKWKATASGTVKSVAAGTSSQVEIPANTFPNGSFFWMVQVTLVNDLVLSSDWFELSTIETAVSSATAVSPASVVVDGSADVVFTWAHAISTGTPQSKADIQTSADGAEWSQLATKTGADTTYTATPGSIPAGRLYWRVRTYNTEGAAGSWSEPVEVTVVIAPSTPAIRVMSAKPSFAISWDTDQQISYEVRLDGKVVASEFSETREYQYNDILPAASYTLEVRAQNAYGLWSPWGSAAITIDNTPSGSLQLFAQSEPGCVELSWTPTGSFDKYIVYRDGVKICETTKTGIVDNFASNERASYVVRGLSSTGYYTESEESTAAATVDTIMVYSLTAREWLRLKLAEQQTRTVSISKKQQAAFTHFTGSDLPEIELGEQLDITYRFACAFPQGDPTAQLFESILGQVVIVKDQHGTVLAGAISALDKSLVQTHIAYTCTVTAVLISEVEVNG